MSTDFDYAAGPHGLSIEQVLQFHEEGYIGPLRACSPDEARQFIETAETDVLSAEMEPEDWPSPSRKHDRHRDSGLVYDFLTQSTIVDPVRSIYGPDLLLWTSHFWKKAPGETGVPWHQEQHFSAIEPPVTATIDLALDPVDETAGCMQVVPGSHEEFIPHGEAAGAESQGLADPAYVDEAAAVNVELEAGEFVLYNSRLAHRTLDNDTDEAHRSISCRMTNPTVHIKSGSALMYDGHASLLVNGEDRHGINRTAEPPE